MKRTLLILLATLIVTACDSSSAPPGDGWLSDVSSADTEVRLHFGSDTFQDAVEATLDASDPGASVDADAFEDETGTRPITHPALARFSSVQIAGEGEHIDFWIEVPLEAIEQAEQAGRTIHGMVRLEGSDLPGPEPGAMQQWHRALGPLVRSETGQVFLQLKLYVAARELYALAVSSPRYTMIRDVDLSRTTRKRRSDHVFDVPWVIACSGGMADPAVCDADPESGSQGRLALTEAHAAAAWLKQQSFDRARFLAVPHAEALRYAEDEVDGTLVSDTAADPDDPVVHIIRLVQQYPCSEPVDASGCYYLSTGEIAIALGAVGSSTGDGTGLANVYVHEMTHGVQSAVTDYVFSERDPGDIRWSWLYEGAADAAAYASQVSGPEALMGVRNRGHWHPWSVAIPLNHDKEQYPYFASEFFMAVDSGHIDYLKPFFERLEETVFFETSYDAVDQAIEAELGSGPLDYLLALVAPAMNLLLEESLGQELPLGLAFLRLMVARTPSQGFPHCDQPPIFVAGLPDDPIVSESVQAVTVPFSSLCWEVEVLDYEANFPGACTKVSLAPGENPDSGRKLVFMLDGGQIHNVSGDPQTIAYANDSLWIQGGTGSVQLIDIDLQRAGQAPPGNRFESLIDVEIDRDCGASQEEMASCFDTRVVCGENTCYLEMTPGDPPDCWVTIGKCVRNDGCYYMEWGQWVPGGFGVCGTTESLMKHFQLPGESVIYENTGVPAHGRCGDTNFCRRIILCK